MNESILKSQLVKLARDTMPGFVIIRHEDRITSGIPDISISGNKKTTWLEVKYGTPKFASKGIQELMCNRLAIAAFACYYVIYLERSGEKWTHIVHPRDVGNEEHWLHFTSGFNHQFVIDSIKKEHLL